MMQEQPIYKEEHRMDKVLEIRWHGRGGQGVKTASLLLAEAVFTAGKHIQGFPEYGPERMGAPITCYNRISEDPILVHSNIYEPDIVVVADGTLIGAVPVTAGLKEGLKIIVNTDETPEKIKEVLQYEGEVYTIDANKISSDILSRPFPNVPMMAAVVKASKVMEEEAFITLMETLFAKKFASKPAMIEGNLKVLRKSLEEVKHCD